MIKKIIISGFILLFSINSFSQNDIETILRYSDTTSFHFSGEWQYLSTDIYLFNPEKFTDLINELPMNAPKKKGLFRKKKIQEEYLEYLFITAKLKNVKFFGNQDITYPLYNFQINQETDNQYRTYVSDNIDHVRILDNLPLYAASDYIDAEVNVKAITNSDSDMILGMIARQLQNLSSITTPTDALMSLIGEFGKFMETNTKKKEYRFSSTIRLYEQNNFDTRLHSIKIYEIVSPNSISELNNFQSVSEFLDTTYNSSLSRSLLSDIVNYQKYPYLVVANYKSLYKMEEVTGDEVTFANIEKRKLKIENDYRASLINTETYRQEKDFIQFITIFANLKTNLEMYKLNYKTANSDAISGGLFRIIQYYRQLLKAFKEIEYKYQRNSTYNSVFKKEYQSILGYAALYLDEDHNLKLSKSLVNTILELEDPKITGLDSVQTEAYLSRLHFADQFKTEILKQSAEGQTILSQIKKMEKKQYENFYKDKVSYIYTLDANNKNLKFYSSFKDKIRSSNCKTCRDSSGIALKDFKTRYTRHLKTIELAKTDSLIENIEEQLFELLETDEFLGQNFKLYYTTDSLPANMKLLYKKYQQSNRDLGDLQDLMTRNVNSRNYEIIKEYNTKLVSLVNSAAYAQGYVRKRKPELCEKPIPVIVPDPKPVIELKQDSVLTTIDSLQVNSDTSSFQLANFIDTYSLKFKDLFEEYSETGKDTILRDRIQLNLLQLDSLKSFHEESTEKDSILNEDFTVEELILNFEEEYKSILKLIKNK